MGPYVHRDAYLLDPASLQLYTTGCFLFALMYTGSNVLPIAKFLHATHMKQAVRNDDIRTLAERRCATKQDRCLVLEESPALVEFTLFQRHGRGFIGTRSLPVIHCLMFSLYRSTQYSRCSILAPLLPTAMVCYLENYGPEKFSEIFLGEFDNPEAIWNMDMRKFMIRKIAVHLAEFTPRLKSNTRAPYQVGLSAACARSL